MLVRNLVQKCCRIFFGGEGSATVGALVAGHCNIDLEIGLDAVSFVKSFTIKAIPARCRGAEAINTYSLARS